MAAAYRREKHALAASTVAPAYKSRLTAQPSSMPPMATFAFRACCAKKRCKAEPTNAQVNTPALPMRVSSKINQIIAIYES